MTRSATRVKQPSIRAVWAAFVPLVDEHDVEIARIAELSAPEASHADDGKASGRRSAGARRLLIARQVNGGFEARVRNCGESPGNGDEDVRVLPGSQVMCRDT
jgi:hypothetical protein